MCSCTCTTSVHPHSLAKSKECGTKIRSDSMGFSIWLFIVLSVCATHAETATVVLFFSLFLDLPRSRDTHKIKQGLRHNAHHKVGAKTLLNETGKWIWGKCGSPNLSSCKQSVELHPSFLLMKQLIFWPLRKTPNKPHGHSSNPNRVEVKCG